MEIHQLKYFVEVVSCGNFTRAAERCHVSQPSLSQQLRKLEDELGQPLVKRTRGGAMPTEFGQTMLGRAQRILMDIGEMHSMAKASSGEIVGKVSISAIPTIAPYCLPTLIEACGKKYPGLELAISEDTTDDLIAKLRQGRLDFGLLSPPFPFEQTMDAVSLGEDELLVSLPLQHPLAKKKTIRLDDLMDYPIVLMKETHCLRRQSISLCDASGVKPCVSIESSQLETVISMVESGYGFSFTPAMAVPYFQHRKVKFRSLKPAAVHREVSLINLRQPSMQFVQRAFANLAEDVLRKIIHN